MKALLICYVFLFLLKLNAQCLPSSMAVVQANNEIDIELYDVQDKVRGIFIKTGLKFLSRKNLPRIIGYNYDNWEFPSAFAISNDQSWSFKISQKVVGKSRSGYVWLDHNYIDGFWKKHLYKPNEKIVFLFAHEITHIIHRKDYLFQRKIRKNKDGKWIFQLDDEGNYLGFFGYIPDSLLNYAEELHADFGAGLAFYDIELFFIDSKIRMAKSKKQHAELLKIYDNKIKIIKDFIFDELATEESPTHGTAEQRYSSFLKGIGVRKRFINSIKELKDQKRIVLQSNHEIIRQLTMEGRNMKSELSKAR